MQKYITLFFSVLLFAACKQAAAPPPDVVSEPQMVNLLTELHLTDGELYTVTPVADTLYKYGREKYIAVFKKHHISEKQFDDSYKYYTQDPQKIQGIYEKVDKVLKAKLDSITKAGKKPGATQQKPQINAVPQE